MKKILVVDDQETIRQLLDVCLRAPEREIALAESGEQALVLARRQAFDLVIMDIMMPGGMDGFETLQRMRGDPAIRDCPVLVLTAKDRSAERARAAEIGAEGFLAKPFHIADLQECVTRLLL